MMNTTAADWSKILPFLTMEERKFVMAVATRRVMWGPLPGPQTLAYESEADVIGYGGAAGGGKTDLAAGKALNQHQRTIVFRRNGTEHTAFIDRLEEILGGRDGYNGKDAIWRLRINGKKKQIELGSMPDAGNERKYRGRPHDLKVFDEASEMLEDQVRFLLAWMRSTDPNQKCQALLCFNPPTTIEGRWIISFFAPWLDKTHPCPAAPGELRWFARSAKGKEVEVPDNRPFVYDKKGRTVYNFDPSEYSGTKADEIIIPQSRTFIPARVTDNPHYGSAYMATLQGLPEPLRSQMLKGDFTAGMEDDAYQVIPSMWIDIAMNRWKDKDRKDEMMSMGIDVARGGRDESVIARRHAGMWFDKAITFPGSATPDGPILAGHVVAHARDDAPQHIDVIGVGSSPYDFLKKAKQPVFGINVGNASITTDQSGLLTFFNLRSELVWKMREALDPANNTGIALPPDEKLRADLAAYKWRPKGKVIYVLGRDEMIKLIGRSPDHASAFILALIDTPKMRNVDGVQKGALDEYNPYA